MSSPKKSDADIPERMTERIEQVREDLKLSRMAFCKKIGFPYPRYHHVTGERKSKPTADLLSAVANHTNVNPAWLLNGVGPPYVNGKAEIADKPLRPPPLAGQGDYVLIPLYNVRSSAGNGELVDWEEVEDLLAFKRDWIMRELRASPEDLMLIHVQGESMVPTLNPGDVILLARYSPQTVSDGIYVIRMGEALLVKRIQFLPEGELMVTSDNSAYQPFRINLRQPQDDFAIIGRVVWAGRRF